MKKRVFYALLILLSIQLSLVGVLKVVGFEPLHQQLSELNVPPAFGLFIGCCEVLAVAGIWLKPTRGVALLGLLFLMISAIAVHVGAGVALTKAIPAGISFLLVCSLLYLNNRTAIQEILRQRASI
ncbi:MAG: DoxX family protein [Cyclobacteriaceae bacterium]|jgi:hypothetical protein|nr:DoxX family protein [Cyclobacteriaceae bacterium]